MPLSIHRILFQQRLLAIRIFIEHHNLSTRIKDRILEHYDLQNKMLRGIVLPPNTRTLLYDAPDVIVDDTLLWEVELFLEGVPIFTVTITALMYKNNSSLPCHMNPILRNVMVE